MRTALPLPTRLALALFASLGLLVLTGNSGCYYRSDDDDDSFCDDDDFDDDDTSDDDNEDCGDDDDGSVVVVFGQTQDAYRLEDFRVEASPDALDHPVARVLDVRGISIFALLGPGAYGAQEFHDVSDRILLANEGLLGLPPHAGRRRFTGVTFASEGIAVSYAQECLVDGAWRDVPAAATVLCWDLSGSLASIENRLSIAANPFEH